MPASEIAVVAMTEKVSVTPVASSTDSATGSSHSSTEFQPHGTWRKPPIAESTVSTPTGHAMASPHSKPGTCRCSRAKALSSPQKTMKRSRNV